MKITQILLQFQTLLRQKLIEALHCIKNNQSVFPYLGTYVVGGESKLNVCFFSVEKQGMGYIGYCLLHNYSPHRKWSEKLTSDRKQVYVFHCIDGLMLGIFFTTVGEKGQKYKGSSVGFLPFRYDQKSCYFPFFFRAGLCFFLLISSKCIFHQIVQVHSLYFHFWVELLFISCEGSRPDVR